MMSAEKTASTSCMQKFVFLTILISTSCFSTEKNQICGAGDFPCLVNNSIALYRSDYELWWEIYHAGYEKAASCESKEAVTTYLALWSGETDGEMSEALYDDTDKLVLKDPECFFEGAEKLEVVQWENFLRKYCPYSDEKSVLETLRKYSGDERFGDKARAILDASDKCLSQE